ncbi:MAG: caspase family protein, partial [Bacteroidota bacterium]
MRHRRSLLRSSLLVFLLSSPIVAAQSGLRDLRPEPAAQSSGPDRLALVIGNSDYAGSDNDLANPANDAHDLADALRQRGFAITRGIDLTHAQMDQAVDAFTSRIQPGTIALFYYAGHGLGLATNQGSYNFLVPTDADIRDESQVRFRTVNASEVLARIQEREPRFTMVILDACRNNPFGRGWRSGGAGWTSMEGTGGSLIVFGTKAGTRASDNAGERNGLFTKWLLHYMDDPGLEVSALLRRVRSQVEGASEQRQQPSWSGGYTGDFYFTPDNREEDPEVVLPPARSVAGVFAEATALFDAENYEAALPLMREAAGLGHATARNILGAMYEFGRGVDQDHREAVRLYRLAADQGHLLAQTNLGRMYAYGRGMARNDHEAVRLFRLAADQGYALAQSNLGFMYLEGRGVTQDYHEAVHLFRLAADQGHDEAQNNLGTMYERGLGGLPIDLSEAVRLFRLAADQGYALAQSNL